MSPLRILLATDGSVEADAARQFLQTLPLPPGSVVHLLDVVSSPILMGRYSAFRRMEQALEDEERRAARILREAREALQREGVEVLTTTRRGEAAREIVRAGEELEVDLVAVGSRGLTGLEGLLLGSVARSVAHSCPRSVLVARRPLNGVREVVVATDGSEHAAGAVRFTTRLPLPDAAQITVVHVARVPMLWAPFDPGDDDAVATEIRREQEEIGVSLVDQARESLTGAGRVVHTQVRVGDPATEILKLAEERNADLIVAGARGTSLIERLLVGSVADRLLREARRSVLIARA